MKKKQMTTSFLSGRCLRKVKVSVALLTAMCAAQNLSAYDCEVDGIYYNLNAEVQTASVTYRDHYTYKYSGTVQIPEEITFNATTYRVTEIGGEAFYQCTSLTAVTLPNSILTIGKSAFQQCRSLTEMTIPNSVVSIGEFAFYGCLLIDVSLGDNLEEIGGSAFSSCTNLAEITIPNSVTTIGNSAFSKSGLIEATIPNSVTELGTSVFRECSNLTKATLGEGVTEVGEYTFYNCSNLAEVTIPSSATMIGEDAFSFCNSLTDVTIPAGVTAIQGSAFLGCGSLREVRSLSPNPPALAETAFDNGTYVNANLSVPEESIRMYRAAAQWRFFVSLGVSEFCEIDNVFYVLSPSTQTAIVTYDITNTNSHQAKSYSGAVTIPENVVYNGTSYHVTEIGPSAFHNCRELTELTIPNSITAIRDWAFYGSSADSPVTIPDNVITIGEAAFNGSHILPAAMTIPNSVTTLGKEAFAQCSFTELTIGSGISTIPDNAFEYCDGLTTITIPSNVTTIRESAFFFCLDLTDVTIGSGVKTIGSSAFAQCRNLTDIHSWNPTPPTVLYLGFNTSRYTAATLYVPTGCKDAYSSADVWMEFQNIEEEDVTSGLASLKADASAAAAGAIYTLGGQHVVSSNLTDLPAGPYIVGGRKVMKR